MSTRRSARASAISYREESDGEDAVDDLTEDEYQGEEQVSDDVLEEAEETPEEDSEEEEQRSPKRRKKNPKPSKNKVSTPSKSAANGKTGDDWAPGVTRVVAKLVGPPTTGHVPKGHLSPNVFNFLGELKDNNDRDWFAKNDAVYRYCWKNFTAFTEAVLEDFMDKVDPTVPWLPSKDYLYRIYRDVRFSNDKTPYKINFCATFSRGGRKGPYAGYHVLVKPGGGSFFAAGRWGTEREHLAIIRQHILDDTPEARELKEVVKDPEFIKWFGPPKGAAAGKTKAKREKSQINPRCNLWGGDDELKVAPKIEGVDKNHKDIDWLKLRSFCAIHK